MQQWKKKQPFKFTRIRVLDGPKPVLSSTRSHFR
ncbi:hypothetical protein COLO4_31835 [Corchorus olitorius]|uniref:Uncharacterized protein n=1 Tax=Corchorus olitorius TaxID=93759 RepID=A0A1R3H392_9ROSI|nr:hypothetical protein COLO4_31835 [Corchorus olitorius]